MFNLNCRFAGASQALRAAALQKVDISALSTIVLKCFVKKSDFVKFPHQQPQRYTDFAPKSILLGILDNVLQTLKVSEPTPPPHSPTDK